MGLTSIVSESLLELSFRAEGEKSCICVSLNCKISRSARDDNRDPSYNENRVCGDTGLILPESGPS